jgi:hypothetical protein
LRTERAEQHHGIRFRIIEEERVRYLPKPISRTRVPLEAPDPDEILARFDDDHAAMAERLLRAGARGWKRWSTLRQKAGPRFSPFEVEIELLDDLCRKAGVIVDDRWRNQRWRPEKFMVDRSIWPWLNILDPETVRQELEQELAHQPLLDALTAGPPAHVDWRSFAFVLRAAEQVLQLGEHGVRPGERELAGLVDHTKAWTPRRKQLLEELLGRPFTELVAPRDRQLGIRGPITQSEGNIWASAVGTIELAVADDARGVVLVENAETFSHLVELAENGWVVLHVPGGPPPAEVDLVRRIALLAPELTMYACFDPDPAGIRIARLLEKHADVTLDPAGMTPELLVEAYHQRELTDWDRCELQRLAGNASAFEPLRAAIEQHGVKAEQETFQRRLLQLFASVDAAPQPAWS